ncbi:MAG TPA: gliding motility-associated C-terminal domain-containing protein [Puia sp.]|nr:gliding motility-associated C-terminal domain-containing protein [Puia sp.]
MLVVFFCAHAEAQLVTARLDLPFNAIVNISFGKGNGDLIPGPPLPPGRTSFQYSTDPCPSTGQYTTARRTSLAGCINKSWEDITVDHTWTDDYGNMMIVNDSTTPYNKIVFIDTVKQPTCNSSLYEFSAAILDIDKPDYCAGVGTLPGFVFRIEDMSGRILQSYWTGRIRHGGDYKRIDYPVSVYGFDFMLPGGISQYVIKIIDSTTGFSKCGYSFAIDDIKLLSIGPRASIVMNGVLPNIVQTSVCYQKDSTISFSGAMDPGYTNPAVQWQVSGDSGTSWTDIPVANGYGYTTPGLSVPGSFLFRMRGSEAFNLGNPFCGSASNSIKVIVDAPPTGYTFTSNSPVCTDSDLVFKLAGGGSYITTGPNGFWDDSPFPHIFNPSVADSGKYYVQVRSPGGCSTTDSTLVKIIGPPAILSGGDQSICYGKTAQLQASGGNAYTWSPPDGLSDPAIATPLASPRKTTKYTVRVTDQTGCGARASVTVRLLDSVLRADFTGADLVCPGDIAPFRDSSLGKILSWDWDFGNGQTSSSQSPPGQKYPSISRETAYSIRLIVMDTAGCTDTASHSIKSVNNCHIGVPSAFTPNGDGNNDYLYPLNAYKATGLVFRVFSRNGQLVFETRNWTKKWDGTINGARQLPGVYVWVLDYTDADGRKVALKGTTILIR